MKPISIQLYTLREAAAKDFPAVLKFLANTGYCGVEFAGLHGHDAKEIATLVGDLGLEVSSSHTALPTQENIAQLADTELTLGNTRVISGFGPDAFGTMDAIKASAEKFEQAAGLLEPYGMTFGFHNHWWEFAVVEGRTVYEILMEEAPDIFSELDVYWTALGKSDPAKIVSQYSARLPLLHIKDGPLKEGAPHLAVGDGVLDMPAIIGAADPSVLEWLVVELDNFDGDMMEAAKRSYDYLTSKRLAKGNV